MTMSGPLPETSTQPGPLGAAEAASLSPDQVLDRLGTGTGGLTEPEAASRLETYGPNAVRTHRASVLAVLARQVDSPLLWLLIAAAAVSALVGEGVDAAIIAIILVASIGLGFVNEYRAALAAEAMHSEIRHLVTVTRGGSRGGSRSPTSSRATSSTSTSGPSCPPTSGCCGERPGMRRVDPHRRVRAGIEVLRPGRAGSGVGRPVVEPVHGHVVHEGSAEAVVVATGAQTEFGRIAVGLGERQPQTEFQIGLTRFSGLLAKVAGVLSVAIFVVNMALGRPVIEAILFSLAVAVGITPQLLPAVVSTSLATGSRRLAQKKVLVKRLVCIEDLGDIDVLFTDKTGTLTDGHISYERAIDAVRRPTTTGVHPRARVQRGHRGRWGGGGWQPARRRPVGVARRGVGNADSYRRLSVAPFDHERRRVSVLVDTATNRSW